MNIKPAFLCTIFGLSVRRKTGVLICVGELIQLIHVKESLKRFEEFFNRPSSLNLSKLQIKNKEMEEGDTGFYLPHGCACLSIPSRTSIPAEEEEDDEDKIGFFLMKF